MGEHTGDGQAEALQDIKVVVEWESTPVMDRLKPCRTRVVYLTNVEPSPMHGCPRQNFLPENLRLRTPCQFSQITCRGALTCDAPSATDSTASSATSSTMTSQLLSDLRALRCQITDTCVCMRAALD